MAADSVRGIAGLISCGCAPRATNAADDLE